MPNRETLLEVISQAYAARGRGDLEGLLAAFHPEGTFTLVGDVKSLHVAGSVQGHRSLRETFDGFIAAFKFVDRQILSEVVEADRAAVHSRLTVQYSDKIRTTDCLDLFEFREGKIIELTEFADTALIKDLMSGETESGTS
jgi:ketosteroid isomerase-like protein